MFNAVKKKMVAAAVKSFMTQFSQLDSLHCAGKISDSDYALRRQTVIFKYREYIISVPAELLPDYVRQ